MIPADRHRGAQLEAMRVMVGAETWPGAARGLVRSLSEQLDWAATALWTIHEASRTIRCDAFWTRTDSCGGELEAVSRRTFFSRGQCLPGRVWSLGTGVWITDLARDMGFLRGREAGAAGLVSACAFPVQIGGRILGALELFSSDPRQDDATLGALLTETAEQIGRLRERMATEEALGESQSLYRDLFVSIQDAVVVTDFDRYLLDANTAFAEIFGYTVEELRGRSIRTIYLSESDFRAVGRILPRSAEAKPATRVMRLMRRSGEAFEAEMNIFPMLGVRAGGFVTIIRDLTETRRAEKALVRSEERFSRIFQSSPAAIGMGTLEGRIIDVNDRYLDFFGYTREEMIGRTVQELGLWADDERRPEIISLLVRDGEVRGQEARFRNKSGEIAVALVSMMVVNLDDENVLVAMLDDITDRKRSEEALARSNAQLSLLVESLPVVVYTARAGEPFETTWVSSNASSVLGHPAEGFTSSPTFWRDHLHPSDAPRILPLLPHVFDLGRLELEYRWRIDEKNYLWLHDVVRVVHAPDGERYLLGVAYDVTARRAAEEERAELLLAERVARSEAESTLSRLRAIQSVTDTALAKLSLDDLLREILARVRGLVRADLADVFLLDPEGRSLRIRAGDGLDVARAAQEDVPLGRGISGRIAATGRPLVVEDLSMADVIGTYVQKMASSLLGVPLFVEGQVIGVMHVGSRVRRHFGPQDVELLQMVADRVAPAIDRARLFEEVRLGREHLQRLSRRLVELQEAERSEIARELHDEIGQLLTGLKLLLEMDGRSRGGGAGPQDPSLQGRTLPVRRDLRHDASESAAMDAHHEIHSIVDDLLSRVRNLSMDLRPAMLDQLGLTPALLWHVERYQTQTGIKVTFHHSGVGRRFASDTEIGAFRIVQEALTNIARHSGSSSAIVEVRADDERLTITVADEGKGFDPDAAQQEATSSGLAGMRERARALGGRVKVVSSAGGGSTLVAELPVTSRQFASRSEA